MTRIGSLFSGYGGLDLGIQSVLGGTVAWHCDFDKGPSKVLAHHWPDVPNLHDVTEIDWASIEPVDIITGGSPCQDVSAAGKRAGMRTGTRSGLWASMCDGIDIIRPSLVVWENVGGALSAGADSNVEPCPVCVGDTADVHLRALGRVLGDLAEIGYDAWWTTVRASDAGAPHSRLRVFVFAWPAANAPGDGRERGRSTRDGRARPAHHDLPPTDAGRGELQRRGVSGDLAGPQGPGQGDRSQRQRDGDTAGHRSAAPADTDGHRRNRGQIDDSEPQRDSLTELQAGRHPEGRHVEAQGLDWGAYGPAITRWESVTGRGAPAPTEPGKTGQPRLSPAFVEWLMGLPDGHVTAVPGLTRNEQLKLLGNGVVPQQAALATRMFLTSTQQGAAA